MGCHLFWLYKIKVLDLHFYIVAKSEVIKIEGPKVVSGGYTKIQMPCSCNDNTDVRGCCLPYGKNKDGWTECPQRVSTAIWLINNNETDTYEAIFGTATSDGGEFWRIAHWFGKSSTDMAEPWTSGDYLSYLAVQIQYCEEMMEEYEDCGDWHRTCRFITWAKRYATAKLSRTKNQ